MFNLHFIYFFASTIFITTPNISKCFSEISRYSVDKKSIIIYKNICLDSSIDSKFIYKIILFKRNSNKTMIERQFVIRSAPDCVRDELGAKYVLSEIFEEKSIIIDYPYLWQTQTIDIEDLKLDCTNILRNQTVSTNLCP